MNSKDQIKTLTIGNFDGIHLAHFELFKFLDEFGAILVIEKNGVKLTPNREKFVNFPIFYYKFSDIKDMSGLEFLQFLKQDFINLEKIVVGYDFRFGKDRLNCATDLKENFCKKVKIVDEFKINDTSIHSSIIKDFLISGEILRANELLGRNYEICGARILGQNLGSKLLYPTINIDTINYFLPQNGVYATQTKVKNETYKSITFIGNRKSTDGKFSIETHIIDKKVEVKANENICISFITKIRDNQKFDSLQKLKEQIKRDIDERYNF